MCTTTIPVSGIRDLDDPQVVTPPTPVFDGKSETAHHPPDVETTATVKAGSKRKSTEDGIPPGATVADTYLKRSRTLIKKAQELEESTGAFVVTFTARPESIGEGRYRQFVSNSLVSPDPDLAKRIDAAIDEIKAIAIEMAHRSRLPIRRTKRVHIDVSTEEEVVISEKALGASSTACAEGQPSTRASAYGNFKQGSGQSFDHSSEAVRLPLGSLPCPAADQTAVRPVQTRISCNIPNIVGEMQALLERNEVDHFIRLLHTHSKDIQLYALAQIKQLMSPDSSTWILRCTMVIPRLVKLLDSIPSGDGEVAQECVLLLSQFSRHWHVSEVMLKTDAIPVLDRLLTRTANEDALEIIVRIMSQCITSSFSLTTHLDNIVPSLLRLLSSGKASHWSTAAEAIKHHFFRDKQRKELIDGGVCRLLCHPPPGIAHQLALEEAAPIIGHWMFNRFTFSDEDVTQVERHVLRPLLSLMHDQSPRVRFGAIRSLCQLSGQPAMARRLDMHTVIPALLLLLSINDDHLFAEVSLAVWQWKCWPSNDIPENVNITTGRRLIALLSCTNIQIARITAHCIALMIEVAGSNLWFMESILPELVGGRGRQSIISLLASEDRDLRDRAADIILTLCFEIHSATPFKLREADIPLLLRGLALESSSNAATTCIPSLIQKAVQSDNNLTAFFIEAGAIPHFVNVLFREKFRYSWWSDVLTCIRLLAESSSVATTALLDAGVVEALIQLILRLWNNWTGKDDGFYDLFYNIFRHVTEVLQYFLADLAHCS